MLLILPLRAEGHLGPIDQAVGSLFDSLLAPISSATCNLEGPMPREMALRRVVDRTEALLRSEGRPVEHEEMMAIARIVDRASLAYHLSPALIFSVIHSESQFRKDVQSPDGAIGLMQIQAETARQFADAAGLTIASYGALFEPETNIFIGAGYLSSLIDQFGDLKTALAAYHVGPTEISRRVTEGEGFSDTYGGRIRARELFYTTSLPVRPNALLESTRS